jgi:hypothetical protein
MIAYVGTYGGGGSGTVWTMKVLNLHRRSVCPTWNYVIKPRHPLL